MVKYNDDALIKTSFLDYEQERCTGCSACCLNHLKNGKYPPLGKAAFVQKAGFTLLF